ncbi:MAG: hypothetical protein GFH27_549333n54 [Chloroflexi bacterium AL-W]|nr:hypothetical protein [Chloroflexi bacterium AL-N1]NOK70493.1 hypothetical protein [Chloroflexi bacterium AL-N10]NOK78148.1 hypothetical protein [Chloroflexi bacterium AL-N5]NOK85247.1 hypothetical protein [Chloroflexi bacterium AL-W]NOK92012.1 hypothetical protein [Chloroflexi bacterium AL-N15]
MYLSDITTHNEHLVNMIYPGDIEKYWVHYNSHWDKIARKKRISSANLFIEEMKMLNQLALLHMAHTIRMKH